MGNKGPQKIDDLFAQPSGTSAPAGDKPQALEDIFKAPGAGVDAPPAVNGSGLNTLGKAIFVGGVNGPTLGYGERLMPQQIRDDANKMPWVKGLSSIPTSIPTMSLANKGASAVAGGAGPLADLISGFGVGAASDPGENGGSRLYRGVLGALGNLGLGQVSRFFEGAPESADTVERMNAPGGQFKSDMEDLYGRAVQRVKDKIGQWGEQKSKIFNDAGNVTVNPYRLPVIPRENPNTAAGAEGGREVPGLERYTNILQGRANGNEVDIPAQRADDLRRYYGKLSKISPVGKSGQQINPSNPVADSGRGYVQGILENQVPAATTLSNQQEEAYKLLEATKLAKRGNVLSNLQAHPANTDTGGNVAALDELAGPDPETGKTLGHMGKLIREAGAYSGQPAHGAIPRAPNLHSFLESMAAKARIPVGHLYNGLPEAGQDAVDLISKVPSESLIQSILNTMRRGDESPQK